jgi:MYXO-CTERM domain-containing protein
MNATRILAGAVLLASSSAVAAPTDLEIYEHPNLRGQSAGYAPHDIDGKPYMRRQVGAGFEHANVAVCGTSILIAGVGSYERDAVGVTPDMHAYGRNIDTNDLLQTMVVAGQMTTEGLEVGGAYYVMPELSGGNRNRDGMKPGVTCLDADAGLFVVAANYAPNDLAQTYAAVFQVGRNDKNDIVATQLGPATMVLASDNDNCSDRDYQDLLVRKNPGFYRVNLTGSCNGNGTDVAWATYFDVACVGTCNIAAGPKAQVSQGQIERYRAQTYQLGPDTFMAIGTEGDTQPPQNGISATVFQGDTLSLLSSTTIAATTTTDLGTFYSTMSHGAQLGPDTFLVTYQQRNGRQRREGKGGTTFMMGVLQADAVAGARWAVEPKAGLIQGFAATHHGSCTTTTGDVAAPKPAAFLISASPNGATPAVGTFVSYTNGALEVGSPITLNTNIDSGLLSNYYGEQPGTQGKNSLYCATMTNPGYGIKGAYRPEVKEFVVVPATSRVPDAAGLMAEKLGLDIVLVPALTDPTVDTSDDDGAATGCGCSTPGQGSSAATFALAFACAAWLRRRRGGAR